MKKTAIAVSALLTVAACAGCGNEDRIPKDWYNDSIAYFETAVNNGWDKADPEKYHVMEPMQASAYVVGADGEKRTSGVSVISGPEEYRDSSNKFGYLLKDLDGDGDYMYLCDNGTLIKESTFGGTTETEAMKYSSENNSFEIVGNGGGIITAGKYDLTPFQ